MAARAKRAANNNENLMISFPQAAAKDHLGARRAEGAFARAPRVRSDSGIIT